MDLSLSEEQRLLGDAAGRFIAGRYSFEQRRAILQSAEGFSRDIWREFADLGWLGLSVPEEFGGLGAGAVETGIVMEALGRALVVEPYLATAVISAGLIAELGTQQQKSDMLPAIADGKSIFAFAQAEPQARFALDDVATKATRAGDGWRIIRTQGSRAGRALGGHAAGYRAHFGRPARPGRHRRLRRAGEVGRA